MKNSIMIFSVTKQSPNMKEMIIIHEENKNSNESKQSNCISFHCSYPIFFPPFLAFFLNNQTEQQ